MKIKTLLFILILATYSVSSQENPKQYLRVFLPYGNWNSIFYTEVLKSKNRDTALEYLPFTRKNPSIFFEHLDNYQYWYEAN